MRIAWNARRRATVDPSRLIVDLSLCPGREDVAFEGTVSTQPRSRCARRATAAPWSASSHPSIFQPVCTRVSDPSEAVGAGTSQVRAVSRGLKV